MKNYKPDVMQAQSSTGSQAEPIVVQVVHYYSKRY